jgi:hypothetical protein
MSALVDHIRRDIQEDAYYAQNFSNNGERFLAWYLRNIYLRTPVQARSDITDGADDKQIDAVVVDDEKRQVLILQGKSYSSTLVDHEPLQEVLAAWLQIRNLPALQENCNQKLKVKLEAVAEALQDEYEVVFELVATGQLTDSAQRDLDAFQESIAEFDHPQATIVLVDENQLQARWDEAMARELAKLSLALQLEPGKYLTLNIADSKIVLEPVMYF